MGRIELTVVGCDDANWQSGAEDRRKLIREGTGSEEVVRKGPGDNGYTIP